MSIEVGKKYRLQNGEILSVVEVADTYVYVKSKKPTSQWGFGVGPLYVYLKSDLEGLDLIGYLDEAEVTKPELK